MLLTDVLTASGKTGESGTLARSLDAIADQSKPISVVVRVPQSQTEAETTANGYSANKKATPKSGLMP